MDKKKYVGRYPVKMIALLLVLVLAVGGVIGGTVAWLIDKPDPVVNTFTYGDINIDLKETDTGLDGDGVATTNKYKMMPGQEIEKDPVITVKAKSEDMWLFVKLEKSSNFDDFMTYEIADGWTALSGADGVYYREVTATEVATADKEVDVIKNNIVTVKDSVTKEQLNALDSVTPVTYPTLTVTAYAVQHAGNNTAGDAWAKVTATT